MIRVLLAEDDDSMRVYLARALERSGYSVVAVDNLSTGARRKLPANSEAFRFIKADVNRHAEIASILPFSSADFNDTVR